MPGRFLVGAGDVPGLRGPAFRESQRTGRIETASHEHHSKRRQQWPAVATLKRAVRSRVPRGSPSPPPPPGARRSSRAALCWPRSPSASSGFQCGRPAVLHQPGQRQRPGRYDHLRFLPCSAPQTMDLSDGPLELSDTGGTQGVLPGPTAELTISARRGQHLSGRPWCDRLDLGLTIAGSFETNDGGGSGERQHDDAHTDCTLSSNSDGIGGGVFDSATEQPDHDRLHRQRPHFRRRIQSRHRR